MEVNDLELARDLIRLLEQKLDDAKKKSDDATISSDRWRERALKAEAELDQTLTYPQIVIKSEDEDENVPKLQLIQLESELTDARKELELSRMNDDIMKGQLTNASEQVVQLQAANCQLAQDRLKYIKWYEDVWFGYVELNKKYQSLRGRATGKFELNGASSYNFNLRSFRTTKGLPDDVLNIRDLKPFLTAPELYFTEEALRLWLVSLSLHQIRLLNHNSSTDNGSRNYLILTSNEAIWPLSGIGTAALITPSYTFDPTLLDGAGDWSSFTFCDYLLERDYRAEVFYGELKESRTTWRYAGTYACSQVEEARFSGIQDAQIEQSMIRRSVARQELVPPILYSSVSRLYQQDILKVRCFILRRVGENGPLAEHMLMRNSSRGHAADYRRWCGLSTNDTEDPEASSQMFNEA